MASMAMPKASINKNQRFIFWKDDIRPPGEAWIMQSKSKAGPMEQAADYDLGPGILPLDTGHHSGTCLCIYHIGHLNTWKHNAGLVS